VTDQLRPLHNNILVRIDPPRTQVGSILIPERSQGEVGTGTVVAVGPGWQDPKTGRRHEMDVQVGDRVAYELLRSIEKVTEKVTEKVPSGQDFAGDDEVTYTVIQERHVLCVLEEGGDVEVLS
jgi:co-chaperonin GroES (HSP10)